MADTLIKYQCPACGAPLEFNPSIQMLHCGSCESTYPQDHFNKQSEQATEKLPPTKIDWNIEGYVKDHQTMGTQSGFSCTSCGAEVVAGDTVATECMYCGNPVVITDNVSGVLTPDLILPFKIDKAKAQEILKDFYKGKKLLPSAFKDNNHVSKISGMYVPFWLFSCTGEGSARFEATKVREWTSGDYEYTETKYYSVDRAGSLGFDYIPVDSSKKMDDKYMEGIEPFDFKEIVPFEPMYMAGYFADKFDENVEESGQRATKRVIASLEDALKDTVVNYDSVTKEDSFIQMNGEDIKYALIPVWMLNTKFGDKTYQFAINGQTGEVAGELPIDKKKLWLYRIGIAVGSFIPIMAITSFFLS